jgi:hypothetical protein
VDLPGRSLLLEREHPLPVRLHVHDRPAPRLGLGEPFLEPADVRAVVGPLAVGVGVVDVQAEARAGDGGRPLQHLEVAVRVAERRDRPPADVHLDADEFATNSTMALFAPPPFHDASGSAPSDAAGSAPRATFETAAVTRTARTSTFTVIGFTTHRHRAVAVAPAWSDSSAWSTLKLPDLWLGGYSLKLWTNWPTTIWAGTNIHSLSAPHRNHIWDSK